MKTKYSTVQMQAGGLTQVQVLMLKYLRTNTCVEYASAQHKHDMMNHAMSSNQ